MATAFKSKGALGGERLCPRAVARPILSGPIRHFAQSVPIAQGSAQALPRMTIHPSANSSAVGASTALPRLMRPISAQCGLSLITAALARRRAMADATISGHGIALSAPRRRATMSASVSCSAGMEPILWWIRRAPLPRNRCVAPAREHRRASAGTERRVFWIDKDALPFKQRGAREVSA